MECVKKEVGAINDACCSRSLVVPESVTSSHLASFRNLFIMLNNTMTNHAKVVKDKHTKQ